MGRKIDLLLETKNHSDLNKMLVLLVLQLYTERSGRPHVGSSLIRYPSHAMEKEMVAESQNSVGKPTTAIHLDLPPSVWNVSLGMTGRQCCHPLAPPFHHSEQLCTSWRGCMFLSKWKTTYSGIFSLIPYMPLWNANAHLKLKSWLFEIVAFLGVLPLLGTPYIFPLPNMKVMCGDVIPPLRLHTTQILPSTFFTFNVQLLQVAMSICPPSIHSSPSPLGLVATWSSCTSSAVAEATGFLI